MTEKSVAKTAKKQGHRFKKGQSGNPNGRPAGSRHKVTLLMEHLLNEQAQVLLEKAVELALTGDGQTLRALLDKLLPNRKDLPIDANLPAVSETKDLPNMTKAILELVGSGNLTPGEAAGISKLIESHIRAVETADLETRLTALETQLTRKDK